MTKTKLVFIALALALVGFFAAPASAQGPTLTADPPSVAAAGEQTFTVTGSGFASASVFLLPCDFPASGNLADVTTDTCDLGQAAPTAVTDGGFSAQVTYDVPAEGIVIAAGDAAQTESASVGITVGGGDDGDLPATGAESTVLVIIGISVALAGLMVYGFSRRLRTA